MQAIRCRSTRHPEGFSSVHMGICRANQGFINQLVRFVPPRLGLILVVDNHISVRSNMSLPDKFVHKFSLMINVLALDSQTFCPRKSVFTQAGSSAHTETVATVWWLILRGGGFGPDFWHLVFYVSQSVRV